MTNYQSFKQIFYSDTLISSWSQSRGWPHLWPMLFWILKTGFFYILDTIDHCVRAVVFASLSEVLNIEIARNTNNAHNETEIVFIDIISNKCKYCLITVYRPPGCTMDCTSNSNSNSNSNSKINLYSAPYTNNHCPAGLYTDEKDTKNTTLNNGNVNGCKRHEKDGLSDCA